MFNIDVLPPGSGVVCFHLFLRQETTTTRVAPFSFRIGIWDLFVHRGQKSYTPSVFGKLRTTPGVRCMKHASSWPQDETGPGIKPGTFGVAEECSTTELTLLLMQRAWIHLSKSYHPVLSFKSSSHLDIKLNEILHIQDTTLIVFIPIILQGRI